MEVSHTMDMILTVIVLSFWFLFPVGMFLSMAYLDKHSGLPSQVIKKEERKMVKIRAPKPQDFRPRHA